MQYALKLLCYVMVGVCVAHLDVGLPVDVFEYLLQAPEAALQATKEALSHLPRPSFQLLLDIGQNGPRQLHESTDERTKSQGTRVKSGTWVSSKKE